MKTIELLKDLLIWNQQMRDVFEQAGEAWADQILVRGGEVYATGDYGFWREAVHRAGGLSMIRKLTPEVILDEKDVVLAGFEYDDPTNPDRLELLKPVLHQGTLVILVAEEGAESQLMEHTLRDDQIILIPSPNGLDGLFTEVGTRKRVGCLTGMANILNLWLVTAAFVDACRRRGRMPNVLVSITHPRGMSWNGQCFKSRFWQEGVVDKPAHPLELWDQLSELFLKNIEFISYEYIEKAAHVINDVSNSGRFINETVAGHWAMNLPHNQFTPESFLTTNSLSSGDLQILLDYNYYPDTVVEPLLSQGVKVILQIAKENPYPQKDFCDAAPSSQGIVLPGYGQIPHHENLFLIPTQWPVFDACLSITDYPYPLIPLSWAGHGATHWALVESFATKP